MLTNSPDLASHWFCFIPSDDSRYYIPGNNNLTQELGIIRSRIYAESEV